jgi:PEP-CTERM motif
MKNIIQPALVSFAAFALFVPAQGAVITLTPSTPAPMVGNNFTVSVFATDVFSSPHEFDELFAFGFNLSSSPGGRITFVSFTAGPLFDALVLAGTDVAGITQAPSLTPPIVEPLLLGTLNFLATGAGAVTLNITADHINNLNEGLQYLSGSDPLAATLNLTVTASEVPEPSTVLMAAAGLGLVSVYFRKR